MRFTFTTYSQEQSVTWDSGRLSGDPYLIKLIEALVSEGVLVSFNYWGARPADLTTEFNAYLTVGSILTSLADAIPTVDRVPDNPAGYEEEGIWLDPEETVVISSADWVTASGCQDASCSPPPAGTGGSKPSGASRRLTLSVREVPRYWDEITSRLRADIPASSVRVRLPFQALDSVLENGYKTQHDTGSSYGGKYDPKLRDKVEQAMYGGTSNRPIYGYLHNSESKITGLSQHHGDAYGSVAIVLKKDSVYDRTSVTFGDSLQLRHAAAPIDLNQVKSWTTDEVHHATVHPEYYGNADEFHVSYVEAHIHGSITRADIESVVIRPYVREGRKSRLVTGEEIESLRDKYPEIQFTVFSSDSTEKFEIGGITASGCVTASGGYNPNQPRDREGQWTAHRGRLTSLSQETLERSIGKGIPGLFRNESLTTPTPWPSAPRLKGEQVYNEALVQAELARPPKLESVDPRLLYATQPGIAKTHVEYYLTDEYLKTGKTAADSGSVSNAFPLIYVNKKGQHLILTGHHRAAAALSRNEDLQARIVREPQD